MNHLQLLVPDLFLPSEVPGAAYAGLKLPGLEKLLARSTQSTLPATTVEDLLCNGYAVKAVAPVRAVADGLDAASGYWLCADPVHLQLQHTQVVLQPDVGCTEAEAAMLCATLNAHFCDDGMVFHAPHPQRWYVRTEGSALATMTPLRVAAWRDVKAYQPKGAEAMRWQRIANEIQMLLHGHAVNQAREARRLPAINSLWLWGGGHAEQLQPSFAAVGGDDALSAAFGKAAGISNAATLRELAAIQGENGLWVCTAPGVAWRRGEIHAWREAVQAVERDVVQPALQALQAGWVRAVTLEVPTEAAMLRFALRRARLWKVWRPARTLAHYAV